jgi:hypothetical protein
MAIAIDDEGLDDRFILTFSIVPNGYLLVCFQEGILDNFECLAADILN